MRPLWKRVRRPLLGEEALGVLPRTPDETKTASEEAVSLDNLGLPARERERHSARAARRQRCARAR